MRISDWSSDVCSSDLHEGNTPGHFSVGYHVTSSDGHKAFMKTSALSLTPGSGDLLHRITTIANAHTFERSVLDHCNGNNMDRVVTALASGDEQVAVDGNFDFIFFLIFKMAAGDKIGTAHVCTQVTTPPLDC